MGGDLDKKKAMDYLQEHFPNANRATRRRVATRLLELRLTELEYMQVAKEIALAESVVHDG